MTFNRAQALARALKPQTYAEGMCLQWTRLMYGIGAVHPDASTAWRNARHRHTDRRPPAGVPVFWTGGAHGYGHVAISLGDGRIRGTDSPDPGRIGTVPLTWPEQRWGLTYAGWSEDLNGVTIPTPRPSLTVVSYNAKEGRGEAAGVAVARIIDAYAPEVLILQETAGNAVAIRRVLKGKYAIHTGTGREGASTWVCVRKGVKLRRAAMLGTRRVWIGPKRRRRLGRAFPLVAPRLEGTYVRLIGVHQVWNRRKNRGAWNAVMRVLIRAAHPLTVPLFMAGDWNVGTDEKGTGSAQALAKRIGGTVVRTGARLDYAVARHLEATGRDGDKYGSDHPVTVFTVRLKEKRK